MKQKAIGENHLYSKVYARGRKYVGRRVVVYVLTDYRAGAIMRANPEKRKLNRVGLTVTKKIGGAVVRNRVKRIMREAYRLAEKNLSLRHGYLVVLVARDGAVGAKTPDITFELETAFQKLGMSAQPCRKDAVDPDAGNPPSGVSASNDAAPDGLTKDNKTADGSPSYGPSDAK